VLLIPRDDDPIPKLVKALGKAAADPLAAAGNQNGVAYAAHA
jgi:hypothetical protein